MSEKSKKAGRKSLAEKREKVIESLWGDETPEVWSRKENNGFTTMPRTLPYVCRVIDSLASSGSPLSQTYLALWFRVFDEGFIEIKDKDALAYESGFSGQRAVTTWAGRMRKLKELGFIDTKPGSSGDLQYVLIVNPLTLIRKMYSDGQKTKDERYNALATRLIDVGGKW